jgi:CubicO group peptidase (beta-lactamase class C family)
VLDVQEAVTRHGVTGAVAGVSYRGERSVAAGGLASAGRKMTVDTPVRIASVTKPVVASALVLAMKGVLDRPVLAQLPELRDQWRASARLTLRQLLGHTSGLRRLREERLGDAGEDDDAAMRGAAMVVRHGQSYRPGGAWQYCNPGFWLAGAVLARTGGGTFEEVLRTTVLDPAGMSRTTFDAPGDAARGHTDGQAVDLVYPRARRPSGGLWSTVDDLLSFAEFVVADDELVARVSRPVAWDGFGTRYGVGFEVAGPALLHDGDVPGFRARLVIVPERRYVAVVVCNDDAGVQLREQVHRRMLKDATGLAPPWRRPSRYPAMAYATGRLVLARGTWYGASRLGMLRTRP